MTPNISSIHTQLTRMWSLRFGYRNCRHIGSNPLKRWSQHAASEPDTNYYTNALDVYGSIDDLDEVAAWLKRDPNVRQVLWRGVPGHFPHHLHVDCYPKMQDRPNYVPPCKGGELEVVYRDGTTGTTFGEEDEMAFKLGDQGKGVAIAQRRLIERNLLEPADDSPYGDNYAGCDGIYGVATADAVRKLQAQNGTDVNGIYDGLTSSLNFEHYPRENL